MYTGLVISKNEKIRKECFEIITNSLKLKLVVIKSVREILKETNFHNHLFVLVTELDKETLDFICEKQSQSPGLTAIFYNHSLNFSGLPNNIPVSRFKLIIGENRKKDLLVIINDLMKNFWRKIPYEQLGVNFDDLSPRMKKAMQYIETAPVQECNSNSIAAYLNISSGYFSQEFKREVKKSFRSFMQGVIDYYEKTILSNVNLSAKNISQILGYSELSSFSRSFKKRKGISPSKYKKMVQI